MKLRSNLRIQLFGESPITNDRLSSSFERISSIKAMLKALLNDESYRQDSPISSNLLIDTLRLLDERAYFYPIWQAIKEFLSLSLSLNGISSNDQSNCIMSCWEMHVVCLDV